MSVNCNCAKIKYPLPGVDLITSPPSVVVVAGLTVVVDVLLIRAPKTILKFQQLSAVP